MTSLYKMGHHGSEGRGALPRRATPPTVEFVIKYRVTVLDDRRCGAAGEEVLPDASGGDANSQVNSVHNL
ncbi:hypothetical protein EVAR_35270_1 [Eumeta japonica]|uniref:Uncharacterized protein n=1 Tax=Eumeta variegata TaxID=151549 RepID=A0A4C1VFE9_EUMVA|nr:hypothetical protein EVAR_35270_1 [Eumeta japonica]